jgi:glutamate racemase
MAVTERLLAREHPSLVVVACNTMSVVALDALRARFPLPFVGVVPAVKPAASLSRRGRVGVLATRQTVEGDYLKRLVEAYARGCAVVSLPAAGLVEYVEQQMYRADPGEKAARVRHEVERFRDGDIDALVLGCTHFLHLEEEFRSLLKEEGITLVDSRDGVTRQVARLLAVLPVAPGATAASTVPEASAAPAAREKDRLYLTGALPLEERYGWFAERFDLHLEGII